MAFLVLMVVLAICAQLRVSTGASQRTAMNDMGITRMDQAIESSLLEVFDQLKTDAEAGADTGAGAGGAAGAAGAGAGAAQVPGAAGAAAGGGQEPVDSHEDAWGKPQRTEISQVELRVFVQDEDSKVNVLGMLAENEDEANKAYERVVKILDTCRQGTTEDIDSNDAERMANVMRDHLRKRANSDSPRTKLLSDTEENPDVGLPLSLKEFAALEPFEPWHFRDYRDDRGKIVHGIGAFLTVYTAMRTGDSLLPATSGAGGGASAAAGGAGAGASNGAAGGASNPAGSSGSPGGKQSQSLGSGSLAGGVPAGASGGQNAAGGQGAQGGANGGSGAQGAGGGSPAASSSGIAVNVNTAPPCVLKALMEDRDISGRWWDSVIEYRNLEEKKEDDKTTEEADPVYDEYGRVVIVRQVFDTLAELDQVPGTERLSADPKAQLLSLLNTQSQIFSIFVTARIVNSNDRNNVDRSRPPLPGEHDDELGNALTRSVRAVVWRVTSDDGTTIVPIIRWEVLDYTPFEVQDYPDEDR